jgi:hypothetical protein
MKKDDQVSKKKTTGDPDPREEYKRNKEIRKEKKKEKDTKKCDLLR